MLTHAGWRVPPFLLNSPVEGGSDVHGVVGRPGRAGGRRPRGRRLLSSQSSRALDRDSEPHRRLAAGPVHSTLAGQKQRPLRGGDIRSLPKIQICPVYVAPRTWLVLMLLRQKHHDIRRQTPVKGISAPFTPSQMQTLPRPLQPRLKGTFDGWGPHPSEAAGRLRTGCVPRSPPGCDSRGEG